MKAAVNRFLPCFLPPTVKTESAWLCYRSHVEQGWIDNPASSPRRAGICIGQNHRDQCRPPPHALPLFLSSNAGRWKTELEHNSNIDITRVWDIQSAKPWIMERHYTVKLDEDELFEFSHFHSQMFYLITSEISPPAVSLFFSSFQWSSAHF